MSLAHVAVAALARFGQPVVYTPQSGGGVPLSALVADFGYGFTPAGWSPEIFAGMARHAEVKIAVADRPDEPERADTITFGGRVYEIRAVRPSPATGPEKVWWVLFCVSDQRRVGSR